MRPFCFSEVKWFQTHFRWKTWQQGLRVNYFSENRSFSQRLHRLSYSLKLLARLKAIYASNASCLSFASWATNLRSVSCASFNLRSASYASCAFFSFASLIFVYTNMRYFSSFSFLIASCFNFSSFLRSALDTEGIHLGWFTFNG